MSYNADLNAKDKNGFTPLHLCVKAARRTQSDYLITKLIMKGADRNVKDNIGRTPYDLS
jgi:ankyrin repeat protein